MTHPTDESVRPDTATTTDTAPDPDAGAAVGEPQQPSPEETPVRATAAGVAEPPPTADGGMSEANGDAESSATPPEQTATSPPSSAEQAASAPSTTDESAAQSSASEVAEEEGPKAESAADEKTSEGDSESSQGEAKVDEEAPIPPERLEVLQPLIAAMESKSPVEGKVIGWNKGGFHVAIGDIPAFCPKSQIEIGNPKKSASYVGRDCPFQIIEIRDAGKRIVVSRAQALQAQREELLAETRKKLKQGTIFEGTVSSITDFGAFVDIGGIEGLVHLSKLSRRRVEHPSELVKVGDTVSVRVLKIEKGGSRISLSMKDLEPDPWETAAEKYPVGEQFKGKILRAADFGLFVELEPGLEGLIHVSQLPHGMDLEDSSLAPGNEVECWVRDVDGSRHRLSLSLREVAATDPWRDISSRYREGAQLEGTVEQVARFGLFIELEPGLTGLLPYSLLQLPEGTRAERMYTPGQSVSVQIDSIDTRRKRISLAPKGRRLEGTKADYQEFKKQQRSEQTNGLNAMAAAFAKLQQ